MIFTDENGKCQIDFSMALWATDELNKIYSESKLSGSIGLCDVDFIAETDTTILFVEYKNANVSGASNPQGFDPSSDKKICNVAKKYYGSLMYINALGKASKRKEYVYILEAPRYDQVMRSFIRNNLKKKLPFLLQTQNKKQNTNKFTHNLIDELKVVSINDWNNQYPNFPLEKVVD